MSDDKNDDYKVGYGKPPKHTQFGQPGGNPGNTKGRPPGRNVLEFHRLSEEALWHCFLDSAQKGVDIFEDGEEKTVPLAMALAKSMAKDALKGDKFARREYLKFLEKATKGKDELVIDTHMIMAGYREGRLRAAQKPGTLECYHEKHRWFMAKKHLRSMEGDNHWPYEDDEPITDEDWAVFLEQYEHLKSNPSNVLSWPPPYPTRLKEERYENMTDEERIREHYELFRHRKEMRKKEGLAKWPYMVEEPAGEEEWKLFEQHIQDRLDGKETPAPWPPDYWDDDTDEEI